MSFNSVLYSSSISAQEHSSECSFETAKSDTSCVLSVESEYNSPDSYSTDAASSEADESPSSNDDVLVPAGSGRRRSRQKQVMKVLSTNIDSLPNKLNELKVLLAHEDIDVVCLSEICPKNSQNRLEDSHIQIPGYTVISNLDRPNVRRGVAIYIKSALKVNNFDLFTSANYFWVESILVELTVGSEKFRIGVIYRSPSSPNSEESFQYVANIINEMTICNPKNVIIAGDFNMPDTRWVDGLGFTLQNNYTNPTLEAFADNLLVQTVEFPTRHRDHQTPSLLDLVLSNNPEKIMSTANLPPLGASDHLCILSAIILNQIPTNKIKRTFVDYKKIRQDLQEIEWENSLQQDTEASWELFKDILLSLELKHTKTYFSERPRTLPYMSPQLKKVINKKKKAWKKYKNCESAAHLEQYKKARNKLRNATRKATIRYEESIALEAKTNPKKFWRYVTSNNPSRRSIHHFTSSDGTKITDPLVMADTLNQCFSSNFSKDPGCPPPDMPTTHIKHPMPPIQFTACDTYKRLKTLDPSKAKGPDGIHPRLLKETAAEIAEPLTRIFQMSIASKTIPSDWKTANVMPVFKKGQKDKPQNYRPISLTSVPSKVMEGVLNDAIVAHLETNSLLYDGQHGFRKGRSVETNLIQSYDIITKMIEEGLPVDVLLLDQAKAFEKVVHSYLERKLEFYQLHQDVREWIIQFLKDRIQRVMMYDEEGNQIMSNPTPVLSGVPQGTKLGPTLFNMFINDSAQSVQNDLKLFADDSKLFGPVANNQQCAALQADLHTLNNWSSSWSLEFNAEKCKVLHLGPKNPGMTYTMTDRTGKLITLETVTEERDLGVIVDDKMKFHSHSKYLAAKGNRSLGLIRRNITSRSPRTIRKLYTGLVRPQLEYGVSLAVPHYVVDKKILESVQRRATKLPTKCKNLSYPERLKKLKLPTLTYRRKRGDAILTHKLLENGVTPGLFNKSLSSHTRGHTKKLQQQRSSRRERSNFFSTRAVPLWNSLSEETVQSKTVDNFKKAIDRDWAAMEWKLHWEASGSTQRN